MTPRSIERVLIDDLEPEQADQARRYYSQGVDPETARAMAKGELAGPDYEEVPINNEASLQQTSIVKAHD